jgi:hypothetical protein
MPEPDQFEVLLAQLPVLRAPAGWQDRVRAAISAGQPPTDIRPHPALRPIWIAGGAAVAAAAALLIYLSIGKPAPTATIAMQVIARGSERRTASMSVGDTIAIRAPGAAAFRVYRNGAQLARCPGAGCIRAADGWTLALPVITAGTIVAVAYTPVLPDPAPGWQPTTSDLDVDLALAARLQIAMVMSTSIDAR